jgi:hypothetical protein
MGGRRREECSRCEADQFIVVPRLRMRGNVPPRTCLYGVRLHEAQRVLYFFNTLESDLEKGMVTGVRKCVPLACLSTTL